MGFVQIFTFPWDFMDSSEIPAKFSKKESLEKICLKKKVEGEREREEKEERTN